MNRPLYILLWASLALSSILAGCGQESESTYLEPHQVVMAFYDNLYFHDAESQEDIAAQAEYISSTFFQVSTDHEKTTLKLMLPSILEMTKKSSGFSIDLSEVSYETLKQDGLSAQVHMSGVSRSTSPSGEVHEKDVDRLYELESIEGVWKMTKLN